VAAALAGAFRAGGGSAAEFGATVGPADPEMAPGCALVSGEATLDGAAEGGAGVFPCATQSAATQTKHVAILNHNFIFCRYLWVPIQCIKLYGTQHYTGVMPDRVPSHSKYFLAKTDPETYPIEQLERDGQTVWDGVKNPQAVRAIREMKAGDRVFIYHSMGDAAIVGLADITGDGRPDPKDAKLAVADFRFAGFIAPPVTLRQIKESGLFADWALVRQSRLSTMSAPESFVKWIKKQRPDSGI
jgi:predicted RNA-binding protein with PUA-like domain